MKRLTILGSTGSIGTSALQVIAACPEEFSVQYLTAGSNAELLIQQALQFQPQAVAIRDEKQYKLIASELRSKNIQVLIGQEGIEEIAGAQDIDLVLNAIAGTAGLVPTYLALQQGKDVALANKESLVMAGEIIKEICARTGAKLLPVDSEHSAIWQCLLGESHQAIKRLILTGSGGPFRQLSLSQFEQIKPADALRHPVWTMGKKITVDSATLMNKGLEIIEAHWLFEIPATQIEVIIHPQSIIHSMVEFCDDSIKAQLGLPDMRLPIQFALNYPHRLALAWEQLDLVKIGNLTFESPDMTKFPALRLAYAALERGGTAPAILNVVNEQAVGAFLRQEIKFTQIPALVEKALSLLPIKAHPDLSAILEIEILARDFVAREINSQERNAIA